MTGAEHYAEAERLLRSAAGDAVTALPDPVGVDAMNAILMYAQVHATLALAAATAWGRIGLTADEHGEQSGYGL